MVSAFFLQFQTTAPKSCYMRPPGGILAPGENFIATGNVSVVITFLFFLLNSFCVWVMIVFSIHKCTFISPFSWFSYFKCNDM